jgi:two-component system chemotaxis response regulator CheB
MLPVRVLVVDDSVVVRKILCDALAICPDIAIAGTASGGEIALAKIPQLNPDVVTLDIEMPGMDGIQTLKQIRQRYPKLPVIMCSTLTERGAAVTLEALSLGASDYVTKPTNSASPASAMLQVRQELAPKIASLAGRRRIQPRPVAPLIPERRQPRQRIDLLAIGTSTGGPNALAAVIPHLPADFPVPVVVVQHMPPLFTRMLADRLNSLSPLTVRQGEEGARLEPGQVWIAPGNFHMTLARNGTGVKLHLNQEPPENSCRPAVDVLFRSVAELFGAHALGVVMTGMGCDGTRGALSIRDRGGSIFTQDEASSVVWGMPGAVVQAGAADKVCPLPDISQEIVRRVAGCRP